MSTATECGTEILLRTIRPNEGDLPPETARWMLRVQLSSEDREKVNQLAAKARAGTLSADERLELDEFERVATLVELMQSKRGFPSKMQVWRHEARMDSALEQLVWARAAGRCEYCQFPSEH